jgi:hypothetical protein
MSPVRGDAQRPRRLRADRGRIVATQARSKAVRVVAVLYPAAVLGEIMATGNHLWLDAVAAPPWRRPGSRWRAACRRADVAAAALAAHHVARDASSTPRSSTCAACGPWAPTRSRLYLKSSRFFQRARLACGLRCRDRRPSMSYLRHYLNSSSARPVCRARGRPRRRRGGDRPRRRRVGAGRRRPSRWRRPCTTRSPLPRSTA